MKHITQRQKTQSLKTRKGQKRAAPSIPAGGGGEVKTHRNKEAIKVTTSYIHPQENVFKSREKAV